jgi:hypothetical protein
MKSIWTPVVHQPYKHLPSRRAFHHFAYQFLNSFSMASVAITIRRGGFGVYIQHHQYYLIVSHHYPILISIVMGCSSALVMAALLGAGFDGEIDVMQQWGRMEDELDYREELAWNVDIGTKSKLQSWWSKLELDLGLYEGCI